MTQEEKQLLLKDLCARLPYGVKCAFRSKDGYIPSTILRVDVENELVLFANRPDTQKDKSTSYLNLTEHIKPYLRPMSSMTEEERKYLLEELGFDEDLENGELNDFGSYVYRSVNVLPLFDWFNEHHLDWRGLIPMGLALEAPKDMYEV